MFVKEYHLYPDYQLTEERHSMKEPQIKEKQENSRGFKDEPHEINIAYYPTQIYETTLMQPRLQYRFQNLTK